MSSKVLLRIGQRISYGFRSRIIVQRRHGAFITFSVLPPSAQLFHMLSSETCSIVLWKSEPVSPY